MRGRAGFLPRNGRGRSSFLSTFRGLSFACSGSPDFFATAIFSTPETETTASLVDTGAEFDDFFAVRIVVLSSFEGTCCGCGLGTDSGDPGGEGGGDVCITTCGLPLMSDVSVRRVHTLAINVVFRLLVGALLFVTPSLETFLSDFTGFTPLPRTA